MTEQNNAEFVETSVNPENVAEGFDPAQFAGKTFRLSGTHTITTAIGKEGNQKDKTVIRITATEVTAEGDGKATELEYEAGSAEVTRATEDGKRVLWKKGETPWSKLSGQQLTKHARAAGFTGDFDTAEGYTILNGQLFELAGVPETYVRTKDAPNGKGKKGETATFTRVYPSKYIGSAEGGAATPSAAAADELEAQVDEVIVEILNTDPNVKDGKLPLSKMAAALAAKLPEQKKAAGELLYTKTWQAKEGRGFSVSKGTVTLG
jgi:hypothetical protein